MADSEVCNGIAMNDSRFDFCGSVNYAVIYMKRILQRLLVMSSAVVCLLLFFGCGQARKEKRVPGTIEFETATGKESNLLAPAVVQVGKDFKVTIYTYGGGCESIGNEEVTVSENTATVKVYDFTTATSSSSVCTLQLKLFPHTVTLRFAKPGEAIIKIVGRRGGNISIWRRGSFVREHHLMVTTDEIKPELDPDLPVDQWTITETGIGPLIIGMNSQEALFMHDNFHFMRELTQELKTKITRIDSASDNGSYVKNLPNPVPLAL